MKKVVITQYRPRLRLALTAAATAVLAVAAFGLYRYTRATTVVDFERAQSERDRLLEERRDLTAKLRASHAEVEKLKDQIVYLQRSAEIDQQACATVKASLASLQEDVAGLQEQVAFYRGIVSPDTSGSGVRVYEFKVHPTATPNVFRYDLVLIQSVRRDRRIAGRIEVSLQGTSAGGQTQVRRLSELTTGGESNLVFSFKYFEEFGGEFRLPDGFRPTRAVVSVLPDGSAPKLESEFDWAKIQGA